VAVEVAVGEAELPIPAQPASADARPVSRAVQRAIRPIDRSIRVGLLLCRILIVAPYTDHDLRSPSRNLACGNRHLQQECHRVRQCESS
jgi:hypothetical protein